MAFFTIRPRRRFDPKSLLPRTRPRSQRFETLSDAREVWRARRPVLMGSPNRIVCNAIGAVDLCFAGGEPCELIICPRCVRRFRRWFASRIVELATGRRSVSMITIYECLYPAGDLREFDVGRFHITLRQRMRRAGLGRTVVLGGTEIAWRDDLGCWLAHVHLIAIDPPPAAIERLRKACRRDGIPGAPTLRVDRVHDLPTVATYVQKFAFWHHPGARTGPRRPAAVPLPKPQARELARHLLSLRFEKMTYLLGCRRVGSKIVPLGTMPSVTT